MNNQVISQNIQNGSGSDSPAVKNRLRKYSDQTASRIISRRGLEKLHLAPTLNVTNLNETAIGKGLDLSKKGLQETFASGLKIFSSGSSGILDLFKKGGANKNWRSILLAVVGGLFAIKTLKGIIDIPKRLLSKESNEKNAPFLISAAKWVAGGSLALGAFKAFTTAGGGITNPALVTGLVTFAGLSMITTAYENDRSTIGRFLELLGLKDKFKSIADDTKLDQMLSS